MPYCEMFFLCKIVPFYSYFLKWSCKTTHFNDELWIHHITLVLKILPKDSFSQYHGRLFLKILLTSSHNLLQLDTQFLRWNQKKDLGHLANNKTLWPGVLNKARCNVIWPFFFVFSFSRSRAKNLYWQKLKLKWNLRKLH